MAAVESNSMNLVSLKPVEKAREAALVGSFAGMWLASGHLILFLLSVLAEGIGFRGIVRTFNHQGIAVLFNEGGAVLRYPEWVFVLEILTVPLFGLVLSRTAKCNPSLVWSCAAGWLGLAAGVSFTFLWVRLSHQGLSEEVMAWIGFAVFGAVLGYAINVIRAVFLMLIVTPLLFELSNFVVPLFFINPPINGLNNDLVYLQWIQRLSLETVLVNTVFGLLLGLALFAAARSTLGRGSSEFCD